MQRLEIFRRISQFIKSIVILALVFSVWCSHVTHTWWHSRYKSAKSFREFRSEEASNETAPIAGPRPLRNTGAEWSFPLQALREAARWGGINCDHPRPSRNRGRRVMGWRGELLQAAERRTTG